MKQDSYLPVCVEWIDSASQNTIWWSLKDINKEMETVNIKMTTFAYLITSNKLEYIFCSSLQFEEGRCVSCGFVFSIPKGCVTKMKKVKIK